MEKYLVEFFDRLENEGWDLGIEYLERQHTQTNNYIKQLISLYWKAYDFMIGEDYDDGLCFELRELAVNKIVDYFTLFWANKLIKLGYRPISVEQYKKGDITIFIDILNRDVMKVNMDNEPIALTIEEMKICLEMLKGEL